MERGKWQRDFFNQLVKEVGVTNDQALTIVGLVCEIRQEAFMDGVIASVRENATVKGV